MARKQRNERQTTTHIVNADRGLAYTGLANYRKGESGKERKEKEAKEKQKRKISTTQMSAK